MRCRLCAIDTQARRRNLPTEELASSLLMILTIVGRIESVSSHCPSSLGFQVSLLPPSVAMDPTSWPQSFVPILQAPLAAAAAASSSSSSSGYLVQGLIPSSASGRHEWVEYVDLPTRDRMNFEFQQRRSDAFDPFPEQQAPARSDAARVQVVDNPCAPQYHRPLARMGPPCADSNAALPATMTITADEWSSTASCKRPIATSAELPSTSQSSGSVLPFQNTRKLSMPDVQLKALSRSDLQFHLPSGRKSEENREESPPSSRVLKSPSEAPFQNEDVGANGVLKKPRVGAEPAATSQQPKTQIMQSQPARSKEKVGERITALQQLVSPYGKTDTASVLSEAIGYIKFLQEQVQVLSSPYIKPALNRQESSRISTSNTDAEAGSDLRSRGLCLVPVSCTLNVASSNGADYWASGVSGGR